MKIAVEGCCHGELDKIYETLEYLEKKDNIKVDLLLICGDFQAVRNRSDLQSMAVPPKYQKMNTFWKYYKGEKKAPVLTVFVGGNHEASNYLQELPYGGWVAHNIYYMGYANVLQFGGVRIGGMSGIWKGRDFHKDKATIHWYSTQLSISLVCDASHFEHPPYNDDTKRSAYHVRSIDIFRLKQIKKPIDIFMSHDWPRGVYNYGNVKELLRKKKFFQEEVEKGILGNPVAEQLMNLIKPDYWFSAHLHVKFAALIEHKLDSGENKLTRFLALDKCLPRRKFLQVIDIPHNTNKPLQLELDPEWLCILKNTNHLLSVSKGNRYMPGPGSSERYDFAVSNDDIKALDADFQGFYKIPNNFQKTAETYEPSKHKNEKASQPQMIINPQTELLCDMLSLTNPYAVFMGKQTHNTDAVDTSFQADTSINNLNEKDDDDIISDDENEPSSFIDTTLDMTLDTSQDTSVFNTTNNPDEISLDDLDEEDEDHPDPEEERENSQSDSVEMAAPSTSGTNPDSLDEEEHRFHDPLGLNEDMIITNQGNLNEKPISGSLLLDSGDKKLLLKEPISAGLDSNVPITNEELISLPIIGSSTPAASGRSPRSPQTGNQSPRSPVACKRTSDESDACMSSPNKTKDSDLDTSMETHGPAKPKKFKRRNQAIYTSTEDDSST